MKMYTSLNLLVLTLFSQQLAIHSLDENVISVYQLTKDTLNDINEVWSTVSKSSSDRTILKKIKEVEQKIHNEKDYMIESAYNTVATINQLMQDHPLLANSLIQLIDKIQRIDFFDNKLQLFIQHINTIEKLTIEQFSSAVVSIEFGIEFLLLDIHDIFTGSSNQAFSEPALLEVVFDHLKQSPKTSCEFSLSIQQIIYQLTNLVTIAELKGYTVMQFSWMFLNIYGKGDFRTESTLMKEAFKTRFHKTQNLVQQVMKTASSEIWKCDPSNNRHIESTTYLQLTRLLQGFVVNEVVMNSDNSCSENCAHYEHGYKQESSCITDDPLCSNQPKCSGSIYNCRFVESHMNICKAPTSSNRRYEFIRYESGKVLGEEKYCKKTTAVNSWYPWYLIYHCSYCFCICDDASSNSDRYISLREATSDISSNMVVTGIKFIKKNGIVHLQIQQGKLLPRGRIDNTTLKWIEPPNLSILDAGMRKGVDYHSFSYSNRAIDLDDVKGPDGYVITGVKFRTVGYHLNLEATVTEINFETGEVSEPSIRISNDNTEKSYNKRTEIKLTNPHIPIKTINSSIPLSKSNQFVKFQESDYGKDASQTTVPYFDAQPCVSSTPTPLSGIGIFFKGQFKYGGFITPKIFTYNLASHVKISLA